MATTATQVGIATRPDQVVDGRMVAPGDQDHQQSRGLQKFGVSCDKVALSPK
jgi:hypothetical protein